MDPDKLVERDRARRQRQLRSAKLQGIVLIGAMLALLVFAVTRYIAHPPKVPSEKEEPPEHAADNRQPKQEDAKVAVAPAAAPSPAPAPESAAAPVSAPTPDKSAAPPPAVASSEPAASATVNTLKGAELMKQLTAKPKVAVSEVLGSIGVGNSAKMSRDLPKVQEARRVLDLLGKVSYVAGKLEYVINKPGIELRMKEYYETRGLKDPEAGDQVADVELQLAGERYLDVVYKNSTRPSGTIHASFTRDERGIVRLDWESFVGFGTMGMREFRDKKPDTPVTLRVYASVDDYYNYEFGDTKKFLSVRLRNADGSEAVNGYCEQGGRVATALTARLATANAADTAKREGDELGKRSWAPIVVKVRFPTNAQSDHCVLLMELMHGQWLAPAGLVE